MPCQVVVTGTLIEKSYRKLNLSLFSWIIFWGFHWEYLCIFMSPVYPVFHTEATVIIISTLIFVQ